MYVTTVLPDALPANKPLVGLIGALVGLLLLQVPPTGLPDNVIVLPPVHTAVGPVMVGAAGLVFTAIA